MRYIWIVIAIVCGIGFSTGDLRADESPFRLLGTAEKTDAATTSVAVTPIRWGCGYGYRPYSSYSFYRPYSYGSYYRGYYGGYPYSAYYGGYPYGSYYGGYPYGSYYGGYPYSSFYGGGYYPYYGGYYGYGNYYRPGISIGIGF